MIGCVSIRHNERPMNQPRHPPLRRVMHGPRVSCITTDEPTVVLSSLSNFSTVSTPCSELSHALLVSIRSSCSRVCNVNCCRRCMPTRYTRGPYPVCHRQQTASLMRSQRSLSTLIGRRRSIRGRKRKRWSSCRHKCVRTERSAHTVSSASKRSY